MGFISAQPFLKDLGWASYHILVFVSSALFLLLPSCSGQKVLSAAFSPFVFSLTWADELRAGEKAGPGN